MKQFYFILVPILFCQFGYGQNAFYDAQELSKITPKEQAQLSAVVDFTQYSDEEQKTIGALNAFLLNPFDTAVDRKLLNPKLIKQLLVKVAYLADPGNKNIHSAFAFKDFAEGQQSALSGFGNTVSRLGSADFQSMLIDATAKYLAQSFKEDITYRYFRLMKDKIDGNPIFKDLFPQTCAAIEKIDPFNFKNLGNSWKAAFEKDVQQLPINIQVFINKNSPNYPWCAKIQASDYFKYYSYSVDILSPLIKGEHPVEVLQTIDKKYYTAPITAAGGEKYKSFIHFLNILQSNLQDSTKQTGTKQFDNLWISFNQLDQLNTPLKRKYFCALIYLQDHPFFDTDLLGLEIKPIILNTANPDDDTNRSKLLKALPNLLILLNQVEGGIQDIKTAKATKSGTASIIDIYAKNVLSIADSTNSVLKQFAPVGSNLETITKKIDVVLTYGNDAFVIYDDVVAKNYTGAIDQALTLLQTIDTKGKINIELIKNVIDANYITQLHKLFSDFNTLNTATGGPNLLEPAFRDVIFNNIKFNVIDLDGFGIDLKLKIDYTNMSKALKGQTDDYLSKIKKSVADLNEKLLANGQQGNINTYLKTIAMISKYGNVIAGVAAAQNSDELETVIKNYVASSGSYVFQRTSLSSISIAAKVGITGGIEGTDNFKQFKPNFGLSVPIGFEFTWGGRTKDKTDYPYLTADNKIKYLTEGSHGFFLQIFDIAAVVNYRLGADSTSSLPQKILLKQVFSPGITYNWGFKNSPFDLGIGGEYTPQLRKIGDQLQANSVRIFIRLSWDKPLIFLHTNRQTKNGFNIGTPN
jgi:hypothetical protein